MARAKLKLGKGQRLYCDGTWLSDGRWILRREVLEQLKLPAELAPLIAGGMQFSRSCDKISIKGQEGFDDDPVENLPRVAAVFVGKTTKPLRFLKVLGGDPPARAAVVGTSEDYNESVAFFDDGYAAMVCDLPVRFRVEAVDSEGVHPLVIHIEDELVGVLLPLDPKKLKGIIGDLVYAGSLLSRE